MSQPQNLTTLDRHRVQVAPGDVIVARWSNCVVVAAGTTEQMQAALADLRPGPAGEVTVDRIRKNLGRHEIAAAVATPDGVHVLASVTMSVIVDGTHLGVDLRVDEPIADFNHIWVGIAGTSPPVHPADALNLYRGTVPGSGIHLLPQSEQFESTDLGTRDQIDRSTPNQLGQSETEGPASTDAGSIRGLITVPTAVEKPATESGGLFSALVAADDPDVIDELGADLTVRLVFDNGAEAQLDRTTELGHAPSAALGVGVVTVLDESGTVAEAHAQLRFDPDGDIWFVDHGSPQGSFVWAVATAEWLRVEPDRPFPVIDGSFFSIGQRRFRVEVTIGSSIDID